MFFAYLRSLQPDDNVAVPILPTALRALLATTDYPPVEPVQLQSQSVRVALTVQSVSPSPFALLRRAKNFRYRDDDIPLRIFQLSDPVEGLSDECKRVLNAISNVNNSTSAEGVLSVTTIKDREPSWSKFQDLGFSGLLEGGESDGEEAEMVVDDHQAMSPRSAISTNTQDEAGMEIARPTTPSWADFMVAGFGEPGSTARSPPPLIGLPPDKILPPIDSASFRVKSATSARRAESALDPGELQGVTPFTIDDAFWWVWISSLAAEEAIARKAVFGRCTVVETKVEGGRWLVVEVINEYPTAKFYC